MPFTVLSLADLTIGVEHKHNALKSYCRDYLAEDAATLDFTLEITEEDLLFEREQTIREYGERIGRAWPEEEIENTAVYRKIADKLLPYSALVLHGSVVAKDNEAFLFTARSGVGKTTHTNLWLRNIQGSFVVNGDKPILRLLDGTVYAYGTPWMGKEHLGCNKKVPLKAICHLQRGEENTIGRTTPEKLLPVLLGQAYWRKENLPSTLRLLSAMTRSLSFYTLHCTMEDEAAWVSYRGMKG